MEPSRLATPTRTSFSSSIISYIFFNRGEYNALCLAEDLVVTTDHDALQLREEKGRKVLRAGLPNTSQLECQEWDTCYVFASPASAP